MISRSFEDLSIVAFMSNRPPRSLNEVARAVTHHGRLNQQSHGNPNMNSRESRTGGILSNASARSPTVTPFCEPQTVQRTASKFLIESGSSVGDR